MVASPSRGRLPIADYTLRLNGPDLRGDWISGPLLRHLLDALDDAVRGAVRLRFAGASTATGPAVPPWVERAAAYDVALPPGDAPVLHLRAPALAGAPPPEAGGAETALAILGRALAAALRPDDDSAALDEELLERFAAFAPLFAQGVESLELRESRADGAVLHLTPRGLQAMERLRARTPGPRRVRLAGRPAARGHGLATFALRLDSAESILCVPASPVAPEVLASPVVVVSGLARFRPSGRVQRVDAERVAAGSERDAQLWQAVPRPMNGVMMVRETRRTQWPGTGLNAAFGSWTDDLDDDEVLRMLEELS